jgi:hypothetical protein
MDETDDATINVIPWDGEGTYGVRIDYGHGSWRSYLVGSHDEARREQARLTVELEVRRAGRYFRC